MKENKKLVSEIIKDIQHDMSDEEILTLLAGSKISENTEKETKKLYSFGQRAADKIAKFAGAGTIVPITGFANAIVSPAMEFKSEGYVLGMAAKMFTIAGPVLVFGISISVLSGLVLWIFRIFA